MQLISQFLHSEQIAVKCNTFLCTICYAITTYP